MHAWRYCEIFTFNYDLNRNIYLGCCNLIYYQCILTLKKLCCTTIFLVQQIIQIEIKLFNAITIKKKEKKKKAFILIKKKHHAKLSIARFFKLQDFIAFPLFFNGVTSAKYLSVRMESVTIRAQQNSFTSSTNIFFYCYNK